MATTMYQHYRLSRVSFPQDLDYIPFLLIHPLIHTALPEFKYFVGISNKRDIVAATKRDIFKKFFGCSTLKPLFARMNPFAESNNFVPLPVKSFSTSTVNMVYPVIYKGVKYYIGGNILLDEHLNILFYIGVPKKDIDILSYSNYTKGLFEGRFELHFVSTTKFLDKIHTNIYKIFMVDVLQYIYNNNASVNISMIQPITLNIIPELQHESLKERIKTIIENSFNNINIVYSNVDLKSYADISRYQIILDNFSVYNLYNYVTLSNYINAYGQTIFNTDVPMNCIYSSRENTVPDWYE